MRVGIKCFIDYYLFIPIPLSKFPATFNLKELKKGYFFHFLTSAEALNPIAEKLIDSFYNCEKGPNCSHRQIVSSSCKHCLAFSSNQALQSSVKLVDLRDLYEEFAMKKRQFPPGCLFALNAMKGAEGTDETDMTIRLCFIENNQNSVTSKVHWFLIANQMLSF